MGRIKYLRVSTTIGHALPKHETSNDALEKKTLVNWLSAHLSMVVDEWDEIGVYH